MKIAHRIKEAMKENGVTQAELSRISGISKSTLSEWLNEKYEPKQNNIYVLAESLKVNPVWLMGLDVSKEVEKNITAIYEHLEPPRQTKVYNFATKQLEEQQQTQTVVTLGKTAAGEPIYQEDIIEEEKEVSAVPAGADVALVVQGDSMEPDFESGSVVFYKKQPQVENGELAVVHIKDDGITFKKVLFDYDDEKIILRSLNDKYEDKVFDADNVNVLGKVIT